LAYLTLIRSFRFFHPRCILYMCLCGGLEIVILNDATNNYQILAIEWRWANIHIWSKVYLTHWELDNAIHYNICLFYKQIKLLEWTNDLEMHHLKGYGKSLNYHMGVPLLKYLFKTWITIFETFIHKSFVVDEKLSNVSPNPPTYTMNFLATKVSVYNFFPPYSLCHPIYKTCQPNFFAIPCYGMFKAIEFDI